MTSYSPRNGISFDADNFRLAMAIVLDTHDLAPEVRQEATALATRLEAPLPISRSALTMARSRDELRKGHGAKARG